MQERIVLQHRVLIGAEFVQRMVDEMRQDLQRAGPVGGIAKGPQTAEIVGKPCLDQVQNLGGHRVRFEPGRGDAQQVGLGGLAVVVVKVPLAAHRLVALHQQPGLAAHLAIEPLHPQFLAALGPGFEFGLAADESVIGQLRDGHGQVVQRGDQAPFPGPRGDHALGAMRRGMAQQLSGNGLCVVRIVQRRIGDAVAGLAQTVRELAHRGEQEGDLLRVVGDIAGLGHHLGHHDQIVGACLAQR